MVQRTASWQTIGECGELGFLNRLLPRLRKGAGVVVGPGQDCALVRRGRHRLLVTVDALVEDVHFRSSWISPRQLGRRSFLVNASDIAAMGGRPRWCVVSVGVPGNYSRRSLLQLHSGIDEAAGECGAFVVGGNLTASSRLWVSVTLIADAPGRTVTRQGARPGDHIFVTGWVGDAALGVIQLKRGLRSSGPIWRYREPQPRLAAGAVLVASGAVSAMVDVSDGLIRDLGHICRASGVGAAVDPWRLPLSRAYRRELGSDPRLALAGGEDYELLCAVPQRKVRLLPQLSRSLGCKITAIGRFIEGKGVHVSGPQRMKPAPTRGGYDHFWRGRAG